MIVAVEIIAAAQIAVISLLALTLVVRRMVLARRDHRREALLARYRDDVIAFVGLDDEQPPPALLELRSAGRREAVAELLARYTGSVKGEPRRRVADFAEHQGYVAAELRDLHARRAWRRGAAARTLGEFGAGSTAGQVADTLALDRSDEVRVAAARALGRIGDRLRPPTWWPPAGIHFRPAWPHRRCSTSAMTRCRGCWGRWRRRRRASAAPPAA
jgi:hypothetical protein